MGLVLPLRDTHSCCRGETSSSSSIQESTGVQSRQWCGEVFHWEKTFYSFALHHHHHLLHHPMVKFALQKYLNMGLNIKRVILPCRDIWWGQSGCAGKDNVRFIKLQQLLCHLHFSVWFLVQACLSCCQVTGDRQSFSWRHSQDGFFFILASLQSPAIIRSL